MATYVNNNTYFTNSDSLGSTRVQTDSSGALAATCQNLPYGQQTNCSDVSPLGFTGKQYDAETGLNDFGARYYASSLGRPDAFTDTGRSALSEPDRFMTPDWSATAEPVPYAKLDNPQTLDLYIYATDNPTTLTDPTEHMAPGSSGPLTLTGPFTDGEDIGWPFAMPWDWATFRPVVVFRNPKVSQKAVNDAKKAQKKACCDPPNSAQRIIRHLPGLMTPFLALERGRAAARRSRGRPERFHSTGERRRAAYPNEL